MLFVSIWVCNLETLSLEPHPLNTDKIQNYVKLCQNTILKTLKCRRNMKLLHVKNLACWNEELEFWRRLTFIATLFFIRIYFILQLHVFNKIV